MDPQASRPWLPLALVLLAVLLVSAWVREMAAFRVRPLPEAGAAPAWYLADADGLYHLRRLERWFEEGGLPAAEDPFLNHPEGSPVPWPPYATLVHGLLLAPFAPADPEARRLWLEPAAGSLPYLWGVAASLACALAAWGLCRRAGPALLAGLAHALSWGSIHYSTPGVADHHALAAFGCAVLLASVAGFLRRGRHGTARGLGAGLLAGFLLGTWVASLLFGLLVQACLGLLLFRERRREDLSFARFGAAFHAGALASVLPAVLQSPWREREPWSVVDLSWFHPALLLVGFLIFLPLLLLPAGHRLRRSLPWAAGALIAALAALLFLLDLGPARALREGLAWAGRANAFMAGIAESEPLLGRDRTGTGGLGTWLGADLVLAAGAFLALAPRLLRGRDEGLLPWAAAFLVFLPLALLQRRFSDLAALPQALLLAWGAAALEQRWRERPVRRTVLPLALLALLLARAPVLEQLGERWRQRQAPPGTVEVRVAGQRLALDWLRRQPSRDAPGGEGVLAPWELGHAIEWGAERPTVATNFGLYVGEEGFLAPARFFLSLPEDPSAEALLRRRGVRWVAVPSTLTGQVRGMVEAAAPERRDELLVSVEGPRGGTGFAPSPAWHRTLGAVLQLDGFWPGQPAPSGPPRYLRQVYVAPVRDPEPLLRLPASVYPLPQPVLRLWERVEGAVLEARGEPGQRLEVELDIAWPGGHRAHWRDGEAVGEDGRVRLRLPWSTEGPNGTARVLTARWRLGGRGGDLRVPEAAVQEGRTIPLP